jgi:thiol-disulfide isomerase/thioredoxin
MKTLLRHSITAFLAAVFLAPGPLAIAKLATDRLAELAKQLTDNPNDTKVLAEYAHRARVEFGQLMLRDLGQAEQLVERMETVLDHFQTGDVAAKTRIAGLKETVAFYRRLVRAGRYQFDQLRQDLSQKPDNIDLILVYEVKLQSDYGRVMNQKPEDVVDGLAKEKEFLDLLRRRTSNDRVVKVIDSLRKGTIPLMEKRLDAFLGRDRLIGRKAPALSDVSAWINAAPVTEQQLRGKVVLLDFWAVWCGPCIAAFPQLRAWNEEFSARGLLMIGVTDYYNYLWDERARGARRSDEAVPAEREQKMLEKFAERHQIRFPVLIDKDHNFSSKYRVTEIPQVVLIDRRGKIRLIRVGNQDPGEIRAMISTLISETP